MKQSKKSPAKDFRAIHAGLNPEGLPSVWRVFPKLSLATSKDKEKTIRKFELWISQVAMNLAIENARTINRDVIYAKFDNIPDHVRRGLKWFKKRHFAKADGVGDADVLLFITAIAMTIPTQISNALNSLVSYRDAEGLDMDHVIKARTIDRPEYRKVKLAK